MNRLGSEKSPYLLQHRDNPVWWYAWGHEALSAAKESNKPIFLSIGYSTCYWCHVMEKDSFEHADVAELLNRWFISIKVDREERPDLDQIYMDAVMGMSGHGGWPMSVFLTPEGLPFWGGTFFQRERFKQTLESLARAWTQRSAEVIGAAQGIRSALDRAMPGGVGSADHALAPVGSGELQVAQAELQTTFDGEHGGFGAAPKFPPAQQLALLLRLPNSAVVGADVLPQGGGGQESGALPLDMVHKTLTEMARGGIFDHLGGGFHRYSVDDSWVVPHFEKMLYDNAILAMTYLEAFQLSKHAIYADVARATLNYLLREMQAEQGGFFAGQDAGEVGREGEFYLWDETQIRAVLQDDVLRAFEESYGFVSNMEGRDAAGHGADRRYQVLVLPKTIPWEARHSGALRAALEALHSARSKRAPPRRDDKILAGWNGLAIRAFARAACVLSEPVYTRAAERAATFIKEHLLHNGHLLRRYCDGDARFGACLDDYTYLIEGLIELYQNSFDERWLTWARELQQQQDDLLWDPKEGAYFYSSAADLLFRRKDVLDNATPSGNAVAFLNLEQLYGYFGDSHYRDRADALLASLAPLVQRYPGAFSKLLQGISQRVRGKKELVVAGVSARVFAERVRKEFAPELILGIALPNSALHNSTVPLLQNRASSADFVAYLCHEGSCRLPSSNIDELMQQIFPDRAP